MWGFLRDWYRPRCCFKVSLTEGWRHLASTLLLPLMRVVQVEVCFGFRCVHVDFVEKSIIMC